MNEIQAYELVKDMSHKNMMANLLFNMIGTSLRAFVYWLIVI